MNRKFLFESNHVSNRRLRFEFKSNQGVVIYVLNADYRRTEMCDSPGTSILKQYCKKLSLCGPLRAYLPTTSEASIGTVLIAEFD